MPLAIICVPIDPSVEPIASINTTCSIRSMRSFLTSVVHMTPDELIILIEDMSYFEPSGLPSSRARTSGLAKLSPTIVSPFTPMALDCFEHLVSFEAACGEVDDVRAPEHRDEPAQPAAGAVHHWGAGDRCVLTAGVGESFDHRRHLLRPSSGNSIPSSG